MRTEPRNYTFIFAFLFGVMVILGTFQNESYGFLVFIGCLGLGVILGSLIQANYPNALRQFYGGGKIEDQDH